MDDTSRIEDVALSQRASPRPSKRQPPELVRNMSTVKRARLERKLIRKIDLRILPSLILMYVMNYLDRNNIAAARLAGLEDPRDQGGLDLSSTQYLTTLSILFVGYILMQVPSNLLLNKIGKPSWYLPTCMIVWGVISAATAQAQSFGGLVAIRFFLGFIEAAYFPGCLFFLSSWYTRKELGFRTAVLYSGSLLSGAFSGLIAAGITNGLDGARGMRAWRWLFIIEGVITIFFAFCAYFMLPDFPRTTKWLTQEEKQLAIWRLEEDIGEDDWVGSHQQTLLHGLKLAVQDMKMWILVRSLHSTSPIFLKTSSPLTPPDGPSLLFRSLRHRYQSLPHRRRDSRILRCRLPTSHSPALRPGSHDHVPERLARRPHGRTLFPHHHPPLLLRHRFYNRCHYYSRGAAVFRNDADARRRVHRVRGCTSLDQQYAAETPFKGESIRDQASLIACVYFADSLL